MTTALAPSLVAKPVPSYHGHLFFWLRSFMNPFDALRDAWFFFRQNLLQIILLCLPFVLVEALIRQQLEGVVAAAQVPLYDVLLGLLFYPLYSAALILFIDACSRGEQPARGALIAASLSLWPRFVLLAGISTLAIMLGASLFILPGLWLMVRLVFSDYLLVLRGLSPLQALQESLQLTRGHFWPLLACVLLVMVPTWVIGFWGGDISADPFGRLALDLLLGLCQLFTTVVVFRLFMLRTGDNAAPLP